MIVDELSQIIFFLVKALLVDSVAPRNRLKVERRILVFIECILEVKYLRDAQYSKNRFVVDIFFVNNCCQQIFEELT